MRFYTRIPIRFRDLDAMSHVNNAVYFSLVEQGRIDYFQHVIGPRHNWKEFGVLIARNEIDYLSPIVLEDELYCGIQVTRVGTKSISIEFELIIQREKGEKTLAAQGKNVLVCHNHVQMKTAAVPTDWKLKIAEYEKG